MCHVVVVGAGCFAMLLGLSVEVEGCSVGKVEVEGCSEGKVEGRKSRGRRMFSRKSYLLECCRTATAVYLPP